MMAREMDHHREGGTHALPKAHWQCLHFLSSIYIHHKHLPLKMLLSKQQLKPWAVIHTQYVFYPYKTNNKQKRGSYRAIQRKRKKESEWRNWNGHLDSISFSSVNISYIPAATLAWGVRGHDDKRMTQEPCEEEKLLESFSRGQRSVLPAKHCTPMRSAVRPHSTRNTDIPIHSVQSVHTHTHTHSSQQHYQFVTHNPFFHVSFSLSKHTQSVL